MSESNVMISKADFERIMRQKQQLKEAQKRYVERNHEAILQKRKEYYRNTLANSEEHRLKKSEYNRALYLRKKAEKAEKANAMVETQEL